MLQLQIFISSWLYTQPPASSEKDKTKQSKTKQKHPKPQKIPADGFSHVAILVAGFSQNLIYLICKRRFIQTSFFFTFIFGLKKV